MSKQLRIGTRSGYVDRTAAPSTPPSPPDLGEALRASKAAAPVKSLVASIGDRLRSAVSDRADRLRVALSGDRAVSPAPTDHTPGAAPEPPCLTRALAQHREKTNA